MAELVALLPRERCARPERVMRAVGDWEPSSFTSDHQRCAKAVESADELRRRALEEHIVVGQYHRRATRHLHRRGSRKQPCILVHCVQRPWSPITALLKGLPGGRNVGRRPAMDGYEARSARWRSKRQLGCDVRVEEDVQVRHACIIPKVRAVSHHAPTRDTTPPKNSHRSTPPPQFTHPSLLAAISPSITPLPLSPCPPGRHLC